MRKLTCALLCLLMILSTAFCLEGCKSREQRLSEETVYEDAQMKAMNKKVVKCINEQDKEGLKKLFSKSAQKDIENAGLRPFALSILFPLKAPISWSSFPSKSSICFCASFEKRFLRPSLSCSFIHLMTLFLVLFICLVV